MSRRLAALALLLLATPAAADQVVSGTSMRVYYDSNGYWNDSGVGSGLQYNHSSASGWVDYSYPGTPYQMFAVEYDQSAVAYQAYATSYSYGTNMTVVSESDDSTAADAVSTYEYSYNDLGLVKTETWDLAGGTMLVELELRNNGTTPMNNIRAISEVARDEFGVRAVIHPHAGGYIEFEDELAQLVQDIDGDEAGLCLDTGHMAYSGTDPVAGLRTYWDRLDYIHFKDIDPAVYDRVMGDKIRFFDACAAGVMCPIGRGSIDYMAVYGLLSEKAYGGYITIEQERDPRNGASVLDDLATSRAFLSSVGFV